MFKARNCTKMNILKTTEVELFDSYLLSFLQENIRIQVGYAVQADAV